MPRTIRTKIYKFSELSNDAKQKAINNWRNDNFRYSDYAWTGEIADSYNAVKENIYDKLEAIQDEISGSRLYTWIINNLSAIWIKRNKISKHKDGSFKNSDFQYKYDCVKFRQSKIAFTNNLENYCFTGYCADMDFMQPVINFLKKPSSNVSNTDLVNDMPTHESILDKEIDWQNTDEYIIETIEANDYEFTKEGNRF